MYLLLCLLGSGFAILAIVADLLGRKGPAKVKAFVERLGKHVQFRRAETPVNNLRQFCATTGTLFLATLASLTASPVYIALQAMLTVSSALWYVDVHRDPAKSESIKTNVRLCAAIGVWILLECFGLCPGFHRVGVLGLELLGCGFIMSRALPRDVLCFAGGVLLTVYAGLGIAFEPDLITHWNWFILNAIYSALGAYALYDTLRARFRSPSDNASQTVAEPVAESAQ